LSWVTSIGNKQKISVFHTDYRKITIIFCVKMISTTRLVLVVS
jgi:hypothetical protein